MAQKLKRQNPRDTRSPRPDHAGPPEKTRTGRFFQGSKDASFGVWLELLALAGVLVVAAVFTATNIFHYPSYELDEGTYVGSAWAMFHRGALYYYTYAYDHPFGGWFQIGAFSEFVGGFFSFGPSVNTGRVLMLVLTIISTLLVYLIVRRATDRVSAGLFAAVIFAVSPLGVSLHRQVYLDNIMTLWFLVSVYALLSDRGGNLGRTVVSAIAFSLSFWSKETALLFLPGMLYLVWTLSHPANRRFATTLWTALVFSATSLFVLLALLKSELLPPGVLGSPSRPHVSLIKTYLQHAHEGGGGPILSSGSDFRIFFGQWISEAPFLMVGGLAAVALGLLFWRRDKLFFAVPLLVLPFVLFFARGGVVRYFWVIPLLAILALALGLLAGHAVNAAGALTGVIDRRWRSAGSFFSGARLAQPAALAVLGLTVFLGIGAVPANYVNFHTDDTSSQIGAEDWVAENVPHNSVILTDSYAWTDLRSKQLAGDKPFKNAHVPETALRDPAVRATVLRNPGDIDYLLYGVARGHESSWIGGRANGRSLPLVEQARKNSYEVRTFRSGDWVMHLRRVRNLHRIPAPDDPLLANTWRTYKARFIENGRVVDPEAHITTSEGQAYAMQRAVYMDDQKTFDKVWGWSQKNLQVRKSDSLLAWKYGKQSGGGTGVTDRSTATDADTDTALALLFASRKFHDPAYAQEARKMLNGIWKEDTTLVGSDSTGYKRVVVAGDWARGDGTDGVQQPVVNPSYLSPYAYKVFAAANPSHRWEDLVGSSYGILREISKSPQLGGKVGLVPDWVALEPGIDPKSGDPLPVPANAEGLRRANVSSYDASRVPWRISLDYLWFGDSRALDALESLNFPEKQIERNGRLDASYDLSGDPTTGSQALSAYAGTLPGLLVGKDPALAQKVFAGRILGAYNNGPGRADAYWGNDPKNYYDQNMAWFATAVMDGSMSNLYAGKETIDWSKTSIDTSLADQTSAKESR